MTENYVHPNSYDGQINSASTEKYLASGADEVQLSFSNDTGVPQFLLSATVIPFDLATEDLSIWVNFYLRDQSKAETVYREYVHLNPNNQAHMNVPVVVPDNHRFDIRAYNKDSAEAYLHSQYSLLTPGGSN